VRKWLVLLVLISVPLLAGTVTRTASFDSDDLIFSTYGGFDNVELRGGTGLLQVGAPRVPLAVQRVLVPAGAVPTGVELVSADWTTIPGRYNLAPAQPDVPLAMPGKVFDLPEQAQDQAIYSANTFYPSSCLRLGEPATLAGYRMASVELRPVRVNPVSGELQLATRIEYRISYDAGNSDAFVPSQEQRDYYSAMVREMVVNDNDVNRFAPSVRRSATLSLPSGNYVYVVISAPPLDTCFARLTAWKTLKGVPATTVLLSYITANYSGYDTQEKIRNFIKDAYQTWGTRYVLLGGSADHKTSGQNIIPTRDCWYTTLGIGYYNDEDTIPCDLYYGGLDGTWDADNDHVYGETGDQADMLSEVFVGRAPVYNVAKAQNFVNKTLVYEQNPPSGYVTKMLVPAAILWDSYNERPMQDSIARMTPSGWTDAKLYERTSTLSRQRMRDSMNSGYGLGNWVGHGDENGIYMGGGAYLNSSDADGLTNGNKLGIHSSIACFTGAWDEVPGGDCFSERLMNRVGGGAVGIAMNSRYGFGSPPNPGPSELLDTVFMSRILNHSEYRAGQALAFSRAYWAPYAGQGMMRYCIYELNYHGDPELPVWTEEPTGLSVAHAGIVNTGIGIPYPVTVSAAYDAPVESALVCLKKGTEVDVKGWTNSSGQVTLYVSPQTPGQMFMAVSAHNHHVYQDTVQVIVPQRYVCYLRSNVLDPGPGGNGDSTLNPGETLKLPMWVKNWGLQRADSVSAKLRAFSSSIQVTDSVKTFGNINAGDSAYTGSNGFGLVVSSGLADGYTAICSLYCTDALDSTWVSSTALIVAAPVLARRAVAVVDTAGGGNNNSVIDPGETADLMVRVRNTGTGHGYNCRAVLRCGDARLTVTDSTAAYGFIRAGDSANNTADRFTVHADITVFPETPMSCTLDLYADGGYVKSEAFILVVGQLRAGDPIPDGPRTPSAYYAYDDTDTLYQAHPTYNWVEVNSVGKALTFVHHNGVVLETLPPAFGPLKFYGQRSTQLSISADGWVCPGNRKTANADNTTLPDADNPPGMVCANWVDLYPLVGDSGAGRIYTYHDAANHRFIVEYDSVRYYWDGRRDKFQVVIYDTTVATYSGDNAILVQYKTASGIAGSTLGIEDPGEIIAVQAFYNGEYHRACAPVGPGRAILYTTDPPLLAGVKDAGRPIGAALKLALDVRPNPLRNRAAIAYAVPVAGRVGISVYDAAGRVVRDLAGGSMAAGRYSATWDGRAADGKLVPEGVYFCKLATPAGTRQQKLIVAR